MIKKGDPIIEYKVEYDCTIKGQTFIYIINNTMTCFNKDFFYIQDANKKIEKKNFLEILGYADEKEFDFKQKLEDSNQFLIYSANEAECGFHLNKSLPIVLSIMTFLSFIFLN